MPAIDAQAQVRNATQRAHPLNLHRAMLFGVISSQVQDPLIDFFKDDPVLYELGSDGDVLYNSYIKGACYFTLACPCFIIHQLMMCGPCALCMMKSTVKESAKASRLILRENTVVYRLDDVEASPLSPGTAFTPICTALVRVKIRSVQIVIPLDQQVEFEIIPPSTHPCGEGWYPVETLLIKTNGLIIAAIDAPTDVQQFLTAFSEQVEKCKSRAASPSSRVPADVMAKHNAVVNLVGAVSGSAIQMMMMDGARSGQGNRRLKRSGQMQQMQMMQQVQVQQYLRAYEEEVQQAERLQQEGGWNNGGGAPMPMAEIVRDVPTSTNTAGYDPNSIAQLSARDIESMLTELGLSEYAESFAKAGIDGSILAIMDEETLKEIGVESALNRKKVLAWVARRKAATNEHPQYAMSNI